MRYILTILLFIQGWLFAIQTDFDVAVVGTSPISLLEAIYHASMNERVLILEADEKCGGAWKSIEILGIPNVDLGCHLIGSDQRLKKFFEEYFCCKFVCLDHPLSEVIDSTLPCPTGFYFSKGCYELTSCLQNMLKSHENIVLIHKKLESVYFDTDRKCVELSLGDERYTTAKLIITPSSYFKVENSLFVNQEPRSHIFNHLYLLIEDSDSFRFTYLNGIIPGMSRAMNQTPFLKLPRENLQLIVIQTHGKNELVDAQRFLEAFIEKGYLSENAKIIETDTYFYQQSYINTSAILKAGWDLIEILDTANFAGMVKNLEKWKKVMIPYKDRVSKSP